MIIQIIIISEEGLAILDRTYDENAVDPFLISGFLAAVIPRMNEFGLSLETMVNEFQNKEDIYLSIFTNEGTIFAAIASQNTSREKVIYLLERISTEIGTQIPLLKNYSVDKQLINELEEKLDIIISQEGITAVSEKSETGILPILNQVFERKMKPEKAAKIILKTFEKKDKKNLDSLKNSLILLDSMFPPTKGSKMDALQVLLKSTYKGVSKMIVRMDQALSF